MAAEHEAAIMQRLELAEDADLQQFWVADVRAVLADLVGLRTVTKELLDSIGAIKFRYDRDHEVVEILGVSFSLEFFKLFVDGHGQDAYVQLQKDADGVLCVTYMVGLREQIAQLRRALESRPDPAQMETMDHLRREYLGWNEGASLTLKSTPAELIHEAAMVEDLVAAAGAFRATAQLDLAVPENREAQLRAAAHLFCVHEKLALARGRLFVWERPR